MVTLVIVLRNALQILLIAIGIAATVAANANAAKRVALVIGTDNYQNLPVLQKAVNDARAVADVLTSIGFEVIKGENLTRRQMNRSLANLERTISPGDQVFFFFAGHGVALGATNYLIPSDMPEPDAGDEGLVRGEAFAVDRIVERIQARGAIASFVVLDACRNNPFKARGVRAIGSTRGLQDISAPKGVFVLFSAGIGQTALDRLHDDDKNSNSVFTRNLVPLLKQPGLSHVQLAKQVQSAVDRLARTVRHEQQPAYYDQVIGNMYLVEAAQNSSLEQKNTALPDSATDDEARSIYNDIKNSGDLITLEIFTKQFPNSIYAKFARGKIEALKSTQIAKLEAESILPKRTGSSDEVIAEYLTWLDAKDTVNSNGVKLDTFGAVLAQDRVNYHRFGIRQELDTDDSVFSNRKMRAKLPQLYKAGDPVEAYIREDVMSGRGHYVFIRVMGENGRATHVNVYEGAG